MNVRGSCVIVHLRYFKDRYLFTSQFGRKGKPGLLCFTKNMFKIKIFHLFDSGTFAFEFSKDAFRSMWLVQTPISPNRFINLHRLYLYNKINYSNTSKEHRLVVLFMLFLMTMVLWQPLIWIISLSVRY